MWGSKHGASGIGILLIFIAFLLVAAIGAGVLLSVNEKFQQDSLSTASAARKQVTTGVKLINVAGTDGLDADIEHMRFIVKLNPGAEPISLNGTVVYLNTHNETTRLLYREGGQCLRSVANGYYTTN